ncbi:MAG TPA: hypothetical protein VLA82_12015 [Actinomycetota bacterium]|nr:hypothetical protein [Actinomycetota bacterium]
MRRATTIAATVVCALTASAALAGCDDLGAALDPDPTGASGPSASRAVIALRSGRALLSVVGDARATLVFGVLTEPVTYAGGEGPASLVWRTSRYELFTLTGDLRLGTRPTSATLGIQLAIEIGPEVVAFTSADGSCTVTVSLAEPRALAGDVACSGLTTADGDITVDVAGTFQAGRRDG